jgi:hypothetical protein
MKKCCDHKRPDRESHIMGLHHDMSKLMNAKANKAGIAPNTQQKELKSLKSSKQPGGK